MMLCMVFIFHSNLKCLFSFDDLSPLFLEINHERSVKPRGEILYLKGIAKMDTEPLGGKT